MPNFKKFEDGEQQWSTTPSDRNFSTNFAESQTTVADMFLVERNNFFTPVMQA